MKTNSPKQDKLNPFFENKQDHSSDVKENKGEKIQVEVNQLIPPLNEIIFDYIGGAFTLPSPRRNKQCFFYRENMEDRLDPKASELASLLMQVEDLQAETIVRTVREKPYLALSYAKAKTPQGQWVYGSLLQIAAMLGDVNVHTNIQDEASLGMVERIKKAAKASDEEVAEHIAMVITSPAALKATEERNQRILDAIEVFGEEIIQKASQFDGAHEFDEKFREFQTFCKEPIDKLKNALKPDPNTPITKGLVFDIEVMHQALKWLKKNVNRMGGSLFAVSSWYTTATDVFLINGLGELQKQAMAADARIISLGMAYWYKGRVPPRVLIDRNGTHYYSPNSRLGTDFHYGYYRIEGPGRREAGFKWWEVWYLKKLIKVKNENFAKLVYVAEDQLELKASGCSIM